MKRDKQGKIRVYGRVVTDWQNAPDVWEMPDPLLPHVNDEVASHIEEDVPDELEDEEGQSDAGTLATVEMGSPSLDSSDSDDWFTDALEEGDEDEDGEDDGDDWSGLNNATQVASQYAPPIIADEIDTAKTRLCTGTFVAANVEV